MLGNDVIDLGDPETATRHPGFDARVFGAREQRAIQDAADPHAMRQMLWAAKESAYKAARRRDRAVVFSPVRFQVHLDASGSGWVSHPSGEARVQLSRAGDCIHAVACQGGDPARSTAGIAETRAGDPGSVARSLALDRISEALEVPREDLEIRRHDRIPELAVCGLPVDVSLTLSHHGRFAAFAALTHAVPRREH